MDKALNALLLNKENPYEVFVKGWTYGLINKNSIYLPTSEKLIYANKDLDITLLTKEDYEEINKRIEEGVIPKLTIKEVTDTKEDKGFDKLTSEEKSFYNFINWLCMKNKAKYMIDGYKEQILPRIKKVHAIQKELKTDNGAGDSLSGFIDLIAEIDDHGVVIIDHKTSAREYAWDSVRKSPQLALYLHLEGQEYNTRKAGFIVMKKQLNKNKIKTCKSCGHIGKGSHKTCDNVIETEPGTGKPYRCNGEWVETFTHEAEFQVLVSEIHPSFETMTMENIDDVTRAIKAEVFPRNFDKCENMFGGKCPYHQF